MRGVPLETRRPVSSRIEGLTPEDCELLRIRLGLSPREFEIAIQLMNGQSPKAIAASLGCSANTVASHLKRACLKARVKNRNLLVARIFTLTIELVKFGGSRGDNSRNDTHAR